MKNIFKLSILGVVLLAVSSCNDKLDILNPNRSSPDGYYQTENEAMAAVNAIYNPLIIDGLFQRITPIYNDGRGDEAVCRSPWGFMITFSNFTIPETEGAGDIAWQGYYIMIAYANQALEAIPTIPDLDADLSNRLMGQAYFLRGFAHFQLANIYGNPAIVLENLDNSEKIFAVTNEGVTKQDVYDAVQADLAMAIPLLPVNYDNTGGPDQGDDGRITSGTANALMGKLLLYQGLHAQAQPYFEAVVNSGEYDLAPNYQDIFSGDPALEAGDPGRIFWADFTTSNSPGFNWGGDPAISWRQFTAVTPTYSVTDFYDFRASQFLYDEMRLELTNGGTLDPRYHATLTSYDVAEGDTIAWGEGWITRGFAPGDFFIAKHTFANVGGGDAFTAGFNYPIIRYADVLLMLAETMANTADIPGAAALVQQVRNRADLPDREAEFAALSLNGFMDQLAHERIMELALEGHRWYDIMRWGWLDDPTRLAELQAHDAEFNTFVPDRKVFPIPVNELDRNPNLVGSTANN